MTTITSDATSTVPSNSRSNSHSRSNSNNSSNPDASPSAGVAEQRTRRPAGSGAVGLTNVIRAEWIKFWSVRSTSVTLIAAGIVTVVFGMIFSAVAESDAQAPGPAAFLSDPVEIALGGLGITEMVIGVLGVMFVAGEYSTGLIRTAFAAAGRRTRVIAGKVAVLGGSVAALGAVASTAAIVAGQAVYAGDAATSSLGDVLDVVAGTTYYLTGIALIGIALGFILRSTAAGIGTLVGTVFIGPNLLQLLPDSMTDVFLKYLPSHSGDAIMTNVANPDLLSTGSAYAVFTAWVIGLLGLAAFLVNRRDA